METIGRMLGWSAVVFIDALVLQFAVAEAVAWWSERRMAGREDIGASEGRKVYAGEK